MTTVLDASALLAYLFGEAGADAVEATLLAGAVMSAVNWAEVLTKLAERGIEPRAEALRLRAGGLIGPTLTLEPFTDEDAAIAASLRPRTRSLGLSLGDRARLALALRLGVPCATVDQSWMSAAVGVEVVCVRARPTP